MKSIFEPDESYVPLIDSLGQHRGERLIFAIGGQWRYYPSFTASEYLDTLARLVRTASLALADEETEYEVRLSMDPHGTPWIEWLLPMEQWRPGALVDPRWDAQVLHYASVFENGTLDPSFAGGCITRVPRAALRFCADLVIRNLAPVSWLFAPASGAVSVYFHNTSSLGVCVRDATNYDCAALITKAERLGLECSRT